MVFRNSNDVNSVIIIIEKNNNKTKTSVTVLPKPLDSNSILDIPESNTDTIIDISDNKNDTKRNLRTIQVTSTVFLLYF